MSEQPNNLVEQLPSPVVDNSKVSQILELDINHFPESRKMGMISRDRTRLALNSIQEALRRSYLDISNFKNIVDFGAGSGQPTFILKQICQITGGSVVALEEHKPGMERIKALIPSVPVYEGDGLEYLKAQDSTVDLITAFMLGPDENGELFTKLADASSKALSSSGKLLIYSDENTMAMLKKRVESLENVNIIPTMNENDSYKFITETVILPKGTCRLLSES